MIKNYLTICWRNLRKNKVFSLINIAGLSLGLTVCFIIMLYVQDELSYDRYNDKADRIARIQFKATMNGGEISEASVMAPVAKTLQHDFPEVEMATRLLPMGTSKVSFGTKLFRDETFALVDSNFLRVFTLPMIQGDAATALSQPNTILLSRASAEKFFGRENPIGKMLGFYNNTTYYKVAGVFDAIPSNSHFHFDMLGTMVGFQDAQSNSWMQGTYFTYVVFRRGTNLASVEAKFPAMVERYMGPQIQTDLGVSLEQFRTKGNKLGFFLQPLTQIHLHPTATNELDPPGNASYVYIFGAIAIFMLLVACINFVNLSTAGASKRAKEVGVRKVIGGRRGELIGQFLTESAMLVFISLVVSLVLIYVTLPLFNEISGKELVFGLSVPVVAGLLGLGLIVTLAAGMYPAFYLSSFKPIAVLKGRPMNNNRSFGLRNGLVVFQFFISMTLIVGTIVVYQQMHYIQNKSLGYHKEQVLVIPNSWALGGNERVFKDLMLKDPRVLDATASWYKPAGPSNFNNTLVYAQGHERSALRTLGYHVDERYIPTLGMEMAAGRNFSKEMRTDSMAMILNESAARALGYTAANAIGQNVVIMKNDKGENLPFHVVGVVKDFHFKSLHEAIAPLVMTLNPEGGLIFKVRTTDVAGLLARMKQQWSAFGVDEAFSYAFMDDLFSKVYSAEEKTSTILTIFAVLTVFVASLGLFGLVTYTAEQRFKEIGVRKVLGATVSQITYMLSMSFLKPVMVACLLAFPASWWATHRWLESFAYRMELRWWVFVVAALGALLVAFVTLSVQAVKAAMANPVRSLRSE